jgi:hypothetical protein
LVVIDAGYIHKFRIRLLDLASFYTRENALNFNAFFTSELNNIYYKVEFDNVRDNRG